MKKKRDGWWWLGDYIGSVSALVASVLYLIDGKGAACGAWLAVSLLFAPWRWQR